MQITIVQVEIEEAIIEHIKRQITINADQEITVDLRATRGAEGYQAIIDIRPKRDGGNGGGGNNTPTPRTPAPESKDDRPSPKADPIEAKVLTPQPNKGPKASAKAQVVAAADETPDPAADEVAEIALPEPVIDVPAELVEQVIAEQNASEVAAIQEDEPAPQPKKSIIFNKQEEEEAPPPPSSAPRSIFASMRKPVNA